jgi:hypothetical protein
MAKEKPILFSTPMVNAILMGNKSMTRRIVKSKTGVFDISMNTDGSNKWPRNLDEDERWISDMTCPYGYVGDILWVRETWCLKTPYGPEEYYFGYKAFDSCLNIKASSKYDYESPDIWKPSIHMPKEACRLFLKITNIRVERLQDISEEDAIREGILRFGPNHWLIYDKTWDISKVAIENGADPITNSALKSFQSLWTSINGMESWNLNPWVWVIEFEKVKMPEDWK